LNVNFVGGAQSTLQDIKLPDAAGGFVYEETKLETRNRFETLNLICLSCRNIFYPRFIEWRTSHDVLELVETSMDSVLIGNKVRYRFQVCDSLFD